MTAERSHKRRVTVVAAIVVPVLVLAGGAAWFVRTYVMPPVAVIAETVPTAGVVPVTAPHAPATAVSETTGSASIESAQPADPPQSDSTANWPPPPAPEWPSQTQRPAPKPASVWDSVPLPRAPRQTNGLALTQMEETPGAPAAVQVPLPRPRISAASETTATVPLPRPRPSDGADR